MRNGMLLKLKKPLVIIDGKALEELFQTLLWSY